MVVGLVAAFVFAWWTYRRTLPPLSRFLRMALALLRFLALAALVLALSQTAVEIHRLRFLPAKVIVLVDLSRSTAIAQTGASARAQLESLLTSGAFRDLSKRVRLEIYGFADSIGARWDSPDEIRRRPAEGSTTDLGRALAEAASLAPDDPPALVLLLSDGAHNSGADPVRRAHSLARPIWAVGLGFSAAKPDLMLTDIQCNPVVYKGSQVPVNVTVRAVHAGGTSAVVRILDPSGRPVATQTLSLQGSFVEKTLRFELEVRQEGRLRYQAQVLPQPDELTPDNNQRSFYLNVQPSLMHLLVMAGPPDPSLGDFVRRLATDPHLALTTRTWRGSGVFYEGGWPPDSLLALTNILVLHHFPVKGAARPELERLARFVKDNALPVLFVDGDQTDYALLEIFQPSLPVTMASTGARPVPAPILPGQRHAIVADPEQVDFGGDWPKLPPLFILPGRFTPKPGAVVAAYALTPTGAKVPALAVMEEGAARSAAVLARDLWRWGMAAPDHQGALEPLLTRMVRYLALRQSAQKVTVQLDREVVSAAEPLRFTVQVLDDNLQPVSNAQVQAVLRLGADSLSLGTMVPLGDGRYLGLARNWGEGEYVLTARAALGDADLGEGSARFAVEPFSIELLNAGLNETLLKSLCETSGGVYLPFDSATAALEGLSLPEEPQPESRRLETAGKTYLLVLTVAALTLEWLIRMRAGMM